MNNTTNNLELKTSIVDEQTYHKHIKSFKTQGHNLSSGNKKPGRAGSFTKLAGELVSSY